MADETQSLNLLEQIQTARERSQPGFLDQVSNILDRVNVNIQAGQGDPRALQKMQAQEQRQQREQNLVDTLARKAEPLKTLDRATFLGFLTAGNTDSAFKMINQAQKADDNIEVSQALLQAPVFQKVRDPNALEAARLLANKGQIDQAFRVVSESAKVRVQDASREALKNIQQTRSYQNLPSAQKFIFDDLVNKGKIGQAGQILETKQAQDDRRANQIRDDRRAESRLELAQASFAQQQDIRAKVEMRRAVKDLEKLRDPGVTNALNIQNALIKAFKPGKKPKTIVDNIALSKGVKLTKDDRKALEKLIEERLEASETVVPGSGFDLPVIGRVLQRREPSKDPQKIFGNIALDFVAQDDLDRDSKIQSQIEMAEAILQGAPVEQKSQLTPRQQRIQLLRKKSKK